MAQEFTINSSAIESKINQLLPSQGGFGAGVDFSASTMVIPIVDLTETAEGSDVRPDLQTALSLGSATAFNFANSTVTLANTPGYYRLVGTILNVTGGANTGKAQIQVTDGTTTKVLYGINFLASSNNTSIAYPFDLNVFIQAGESIQGVSPKASDVFLGSSRQIADVNGNLVNP